MRRAYRMLLGLYPWDYRAAFAAEMTAAFDSVFEQRRGGLWFLAAAELAGLIRGAVREWIAKFTTNPVVRGRAMPDIRMMRPPNIPREIWFRGPASGSGDQCSSDMLP